MSSNESRKGRVGRALIAFAAVAATSGALAVPAGAASGQGAAAIALANHSKGRTLSGQGVKVLANAPATKSGLLLNLPISEVDPGATASATVNGSLRFKRGGKSLQLTGLRFNLAAGTLSGQLGDEQIDVFKLGAAANVNSTTGAVSLGDGKLRLTEDAANALKEQLGLDRALVRKGVGMVWLAAKANPTHAATQTVTSGKLDWGFLTSWREYIYKILGPGSVGSITTEGGATTTGEPSKAGSFFSFPAAGGSFKKGLYGASDLLTLNTQGSVIFAKPGHCIKEIKFTNIIVTLDGAQSSIVVDLTYDIDKFNKTTMMCDDVPTVNAPGTKIATLDASGVTSTYSADGKAVTTPNVPGALTAAGAVPFGPPYKEGTVLDPATISVGLG